VVDCSERSSDGNDLAMGSVGQDFVLSLQLLVFLLGVLGESPVLRDLNFLLSWVLVLGSSEGLDGDGLVGFLGSNGHQDLSNINSGNSPAGLSKGTSHTSLEPISSSTRKHFVDSQYVPWVNSHSEMESVFSSQLGQVLVGADTGCLKSLAGKLFLLVGNHVNAEGEVINVSLLSTQIVDSELWLGHTTTVSRLDVRLSLLPSVTLSRPSDEPSTSTQDNKKFKSLKTGDSPSTPRRNTKS